MTHAPPAQQAGAEEQLPFDPLRLALGLVSRWKLILIGGALIGTVLAAAASFVGKPSYEARVGLVKRKSHNEILLDRNVVIEQEDYSMSTVAGSVKTLRVLTQVQGEVSYPGSLAALSRSITVENPRQTELLQMRVHDRDPVRAAAIASSLLTHFQADHRERMLTNAREAIRVLSGRRARVRENLSRLETERAQLLADNGFSDVKGERTALLEQRNFAEQELIRSREALRRALQARKDLEARVGSEPAMVLFSETEELPLQRELARVEVELAGLLQRYTPEHPKVVDLQQRVSELRKRVAEGQDHRLRKVTQQINPIRGQLQLRIATAAVDAEVARARAAALETLRERVRGRLALLREIERELNRLDRTMGEARELLTAYRNGIESAEILLASQAPAFEVVEAPLVPSQPLPSKKKLLVGVGFVAGFVLPLLLALVLELRDTRIRAAKELHDLGLRTVHVLPAPRGDADARYALAAQVLFPQAPSLPPPILAGLTAGGEPQALAAAFSQLGAQPLSADEVADAPVPSEWLDRQLLLVVPAGRVPRDTIERYLRRARLLGAAPTAAIFLAEGDVPFDTLEA